MRVDDLHERGIASVVCGDGVDGVGDYGVG